MARLGSQVNDFSQLLPFLLRTWMYVSGVLFNIATLSLSVPPLVVAVLQLNPAALYITLMRNALLVTQRQSCAGLEPFNAQLCAEWNTPAKVRPRPRLSCMTARTAAAIANPDHFWYYAIGWAVVAIVVGFFFFWRAEAKYGRG